MLLPKTLGYSDYMVSFELLYRDLKTTNWKTLQDENIKSKLPGTAFSSFKKEETFKKKKNKSNLSETELNAFSFLLQNKNNIIQNTDKGNTIVVIDNDAYKKINESFRFRSFKTLKTWHSRRKAFKFYS